MSAGLGARRRARPRCALPDLALLFVGGDDYAEITDDIWKFAIVGTLLSMIQLLVYCALARRQGRAVVMIWTALGVLVVGAIAVAERDLAGAGGRRWSTLRCSSSLLAVALSRRAPPRPTSPLRSERPRRSA